jgi:predicted HNH restriction endonuclease
MPTFRQPNTPRTQIRRQIRILWMRSRERSQAMKNAHYCCEKCGKKQSKAKGKEQKIEVHHKQGIGNWDEVIRVIQEQILVNPNQLECLCPECHGVVEHGRKIRL